MGSNFKQTVKRYVQRSLPLIYLLAIAMAFQNCGSDPVSFKSSELASTSLGGKPDGSLLVNNGASYTNDQKIVVDVFASNASEMILQLDRCPDPAAGNWRALVVRNEQVLRDADGGHDVFAILRNNAGEVSVCLKASIQLDRVSPSIAYVQTPAKISNSALGAFGFQAQDTLSGIAKLMCRMKDATTFKECATSTLIEGLKDGTRGLSAYAVDKAGNKSETIDYSWLVDLTRPTVAILDPKPSAVSNSGTVLVYFAGSDLGSGLSSYKCFLNGTQLSECSSPVLLTVTADGAYSFNVVAVDKAGWESSPAQVGFSVDRQPSAEFNILGVTGGSDVKVDNYLSENASPMVSWTPSENAQSYRAHILNTAGSQVICGPVDVNGGQNSTAFSGCVLNDATSYRAAVSAYRNGVERKAVDFSFKTDYSAPVISITNLVKSDDTKKAKFDFSVVDVGSGLASVTCYRSFKTDTQEINCAGKTSVEFTNLPEGTHKFSISAVDKVGHNSTSTVVEFTMNYIVCDPFRLVEGQCLKGLRSTLYYANPTQLASNPGSQFGSVADLIAKGSKSNAVIYLPYLDVPTRDFTSGFSTTENGTLKDDSGNKLYEWFALDMETVLKLAPGEEAGYYQLLVASDDGSVVYADVNSNGNFRKVIDNDGQHSTKIGCMNTGDVIQMTSTSRIPLKIQYYQGPKTEISMSIYWRKVPAPNSAHSQYCGSAGSGSRGFDTANNLNKLTAEGFTALKSGNFILDEVAK